MSHPALDELAAKAAAVHEALPWIKRLAGRTVVVKYGGAAMGTAGFDAFVDDVVLLRYVGVDVVVVHGGGPEVSRLMTRFGKEPVFVDGHRVTDAETMDLVRMVLVGRVNKVLVGRINTHGRLAVGLSGEDGLLLVAKPRVDPGGRDLGFVGDVDAVDPTALRALADRGLVPVVATVAAGPGGQPYNVNADAAAGALAAALGAEKLVYLTDVEGLYADLDDPGSLIHQLTVEEVEELLAGGRCSAGMIPKLTGIVAALRGGVRRAHVLDGRREHAILLELFTDSGIGTMIHAEAAPEGSGEPRRGAPVGREGSGEPRRGAPVAPVGRVASVEDLGSHRLLLALQEDAALEALSRGLLAPLRAYDRRQHGDLVASLRTFLEHNGNWEAAARALGVHRHTLRYRIRRVAELTGRDLESAGDRVEFWLALQAADVLGGRRGRQA